MPLTIEQDVRLLIQDQPALAAYNLYGDGTASAYLLKHANLTSASAFAPSLGGQTAWVPTAATFNASGMVSFDRGLPNESAYRLTYTYSVFSDEEIDQFLLNGGSRNGAAREAVKVLMFDGVKRARWVAPDGSSYDDTAALEHLRAMYALFTEALTQDSGAEGGVVAWSETQGWL